MYKVTSQLQPKVNKTTEESNKNVHKNQRWLESHHHSYQICPLAAEVVCQPWPPAIHLARVVAHPRQSSLWKRLAAQLSDSSVHCLQIPWNPSTIQNKLMRTAINLGVSSLYQTLVLSILLYASETWTLLASDMKAIESFHMKC